MNLRGSETIDRLLRQMQREDIGSAGHGSQTHPRLPLDVLRSLWNTADADVELSLPALPCVTTGQAVGDGNDSTSNQRIASNARQRLHRVPRNVSRRFPLVPMVLLVAITCAAGILLVVRSATGNLETEAILCRIAAGTGILQHDGKSQSVSSGAVLRAGDELTSGSRMVIDYPDGTTFAFVAGSRWRVHAPNADA